MALKFSEMITTRTDLALNLEAGFDHYIDSIATGYGNYLAPVLKEGETALDVRFQLVLLKRSVARQRQRLQSLSTGVVEQTHDDQKVSAEITDRRDAVDTKLRHVRSTCRGIYGVKSLGRVGLKGNFPRGPVRLHDHAATVKASLENPDLGLEPVLALDLGDEEVAGPSQLAAQLEPELTELGDLVGDRHQERRKGFDVRSRRRRLIREFDGDIRAVVRMAQGMFRLAGRDDLADSFRPTLRRIVRRIKEAQAEEAAEQAAEQTAEQTADGYAGAETTEAEAAETEQEVTEETTD
ncbi:MAG: hypothetical protein GY719_39125 [bacterium]|nr:hypothetical protein [bacterium]